MAKAKKTKAVKKPAKKMASPKKAVKKSSSAKKTAKSAAKKKPAKPIKRIIKSENKKETMAKKKSKSAAASKASSAKATSKKEKETKSTPALTGVPTPKVKYLADVKPEKEKKKTKEDKEEEKAISYEEDETWGGSTFSEMRNYEPEPVYRKPDPPQPKFQGKQDTRSRYTDKELAEFRQIINEKIAEAEHDYELLKNTLAHRGEHGTDDTSPTFKVLEDGSDAMSREEIAQLAARQDRYIQNLKNALIRIENKTYGICRVTGKLIPKERLRSVPHATLSIEAKLTQNN